MRREEKERVVSTAGAALLAGALLLFGCGPEGAPGESGEEPVILSEGIVTATSSRYFELGSEEPYEQFEVVAVFPRFSIEKMDQVDSLLGARASQVELALDTCSSPAPVFANAQRRTKEDDTTIELMDVGDVSLEYGGVKRAVPTRTFPDLLKVIDGVIYSAAEGRGISYAPGETYTFHAAGTDAVDQFDVLLEAPDDLGDVKLDGEPITDTHPTIHSGEALVLSWEGEGYGDEVFATLDWTSMGLQWSVTCRMRDDGRFIVPAEITADMYDPMAGSDHEMTLSRIRQVAFRSRGLSSGEFRFVVTTSFLVAFESAR